MSNGSAVTEIPALLVAGGRPRDPGIMTAMFSHAFRELHKPLVAYIGTANGDNPGFFERMGSLLKEAGAGEVVLVRLAKDNPDLDAVKKTLAKADVIFISGGEVEDGMYWLTKHDLKSFLKDLYNKGKRFLGVSAGVIMMGTHWVHWDIEGDDSTSSLFDCLAFTPVLFDVHGEDEDWIELKAALKLLGNGTRGYGLPGGCMISADSRGDLINISKDYLVFVNENGNIRII